MTVTIENLYTGNGSTTDYSFTFPYLDTTDIKVTLATVATTAYSLLNATTVRFDSAPGNGVAIRIYRETAFSTPKATFYPGSAIRANDLNDNTLQNLYVNQESNDKVADAWLRGDQTVISTETWYTTDDTKVASTKAIEGRIDTKIDTALTGDIAAGNKITVTDNSPSSGQITVALTSGSLVNSDVNASAAIAGTKISPDFGSQNIVTTGTVDGRDVSADGTKLDGIESGATADQSNAEIRTAVEAATDSNVFTDADHTKLNAIEDNATRDQTAAEIRTLVESASDSNVFTDADHSKLNAIEASATADQTASEIRTLVEAASDSNVFTDADHTKLNAIEASATADQTDAEIRAAVEAATDSNVFTDADHSKLNAIEASATADQTASEIKTLLQSDKLTSSEIATGTLDGRYYTETELNAGQLDNRYYTETESDARYFNISTGDTIKDGDTFPDNDTTIATTAAINDRIIDLVDDVGGFVPIANETSFPNANPDVNNGAGTLVSIKALSSNLTSNGSGVATISNGTVGNSTVTINGLANSTTYAANFGMIVETTTTLNTYTFHRQVPIATEVSSVAGSISNVNTVAGNISNVNTVAGNNSNVTTVAGANSNITAVAGSISNVNTVATNISNVNDFSDKYRVASSAPTSSLDTGDLYFDTSANELKVYNGSAWQGGVTALGNLAGLGANTFTGHQSLGDGLNAQFGAGNDLKIFHDGVNHNSKIIHTGAGGLYIGADTFALQNGTTDENYIVMSDNGAVELYYDNSKKLETFANGATITGTLYATDAVYVGDTSDSGSTDYIAVGTGKDLKLYHDGTDSYIQNTTGVLRVNNDGTDLVLSTDSNVHIRTNGTEEAVKAIVNGAVELYYDNSKKLETTSGGISMSGEVHLQGNHLYGNDNSKIRLGGSQDLEIYHSGTTNYIVAKTHNLHIDTNGGNENAAILKQNGAVELYYDSSKKFETTSGGGSLTGDWNVSNDFFWFDNGEAVFGSGGDLKVYHDGSNSYLKAVSGGTGNLYIFADGKTIYLRPKSGEDGIKVIPDGAVELYYNNVKTVETYDASDYSGITVLGDEGGNAVINMYADEGDDAADKWQWTAQTNGASYFKNYSNGSSYEYNIKMIGGGAVELYYDNVLRFETTSYGNSVHGHFDIAGDNERLRIGGSYDLQIYHDGNNSYIKDNGTGGIYIDTSFLHVRQGSGESMINAVADAQVELYYDNGKVLQTDANGIMVFGQEGGSANIYLYADEGDDNSDKFQFTVNDGGPLRIQNRASGGVENNIVCHGNGNAELYYDNVKRFSTESYGTVTHGTLHKILGGEGESADLLLFADEADDADDKYKLTSKTNGDFAVENYRNGSGWETNLTCTGDGAVDLYHNNSKKLATTSTGVTVTGAISDSAGELRSIPIQTETSAHTPNASSAGYVIYTTAGVTINNSVFSTGDALTIINNSGSNITITQGSGLTLYNTADAATGNRTLAGRGMSTIWFASASVAYITGAGLS